MYYNAARSQSDAKPCVALIREMHKFITKKVGGFLTTTRKNARMGSESILASCCVSTASTQRIVYARAILHYL